MKRVALLVDKVRFEEKRIASRLREWSSVELVHADKRIQWLKPPRQTRSRGFGSFDVAVVRPLSMYLAAYASALAEAWGLPTVNPSEAILYSGDKLLAYSRLASHGIPIPPTGFLAGGAESLGLDESVEYVLKPPVGSWGRLVSRVHGLGEARLHAALRARLPCMVQRVSIVQEYVVGGERDYRCLVVGGEGLGCIVRSSSVGEWRSNVALGASVEPVGDSGLLGELLEASIRAAEAVGGVFVSVDLFYSEGDGVLVNEVNGVPEFKGFYRAYGGRVDPALRLSEWLRLRLRR